MPIKGISFATLNPPGCAAAPAMDGFAVLTSSAWILPAGPLPATAARSTAFLFGNTACGRCGFDLAVRCRLCCQVFFNILLGDLAAFSGACHLADIHLFFLRQSVVQPVKWKRRLALAISQPLFPQVWNFPLPLELHRFPASASGTFSPGCRI